MSITTLVTFIRITDSSGRGKFGYQNAKRNDTSTPLTNESRDIETIKYNKNRSSFEGNTINFQSKGAGKAGIYWYLPFIYQGAAKNRSGDNIEASLVFANNILAMNRAREAVKEKWHVEVSVCIADPMTLDIQRILTSDYWLVTSMTYDFETIEVLLSSGIDAVGSNAPTRVLTSSMVGSLPTSGRIQNI
tara:strand:- start:4048 stop:4617 length:570 start_codon:yes stop_codon:yes gene_type:complete